MTQRSQRFALTAIAAAAGLFIFAAGPATAMQISIPTGIKLPNPYTPGGTATDGTQAGGLSTLPDVGGDGGGGGGGGGGGSW